MEDRYHVDEHGNQYVRRCPACQGLTCTVTNVAGQIVYCACTVCYRRIESEQVQAWQAREAALRREYEADDGQVTEWNGDIGGYVVM
jgi:hypothetical protein